MAKSLCSHDWGNVEFTDRLCRSSQRTCRKCGMIKPTSSSHADFCDHVWQTEWLDWCGDHSQEKCGRCGAVQSNNGGMSTFGWSQAMRESRRRD